MHRQYQHRIFINFFSKNQVQNFLEKASSFIKRALVVGDRRERCQGNIKKQTKILFSIASTAEILNDCNVETSWNQRWMVCGPEPPASDVLLTSPQPVLISYSKLSSSHLVQQQKIQ